MNEKINLQGIVALLAEKSGITKKEAESFLKEYFETINEALLRDKIVKIKNLGNFKLVEVSDRESVDVATGNRVLIPAHYKINFIPDNNLAQAVNEPFAFFEVMDLDENENEEDKKEKEEPENEEEEPPKILVVELAEPEYPEYPDYKQNKRRRKKRLKWESVFFVIALLIMAGLFYLLYTVDKKDADSNRFEIYSSDTKEVIDTIKTQIDTIKTQIDTIKTQISKIESVVLPDKKRTIRSGERLTLIALDEYGHKSFWVYLYEENKDILKNPHNVPAGLKIKIPPAEKYGINKNDSAAIKKAEALAKEIGR